jgi:hypothetical protein
MKNLSIFQSPETSYRLKMFFRFTAMFLWEWSFAQPHKRSPLIVDLTRVLSRRKADNERLQHTDVTNLNNQQFKNSMNIRIKVFVSKTSLWFYDYLFFSALLNKQSNCSLLRFVFSNWINVLASSKAEVSYVFYRNDVGRLQTATLDILLLPNTGLDSKDIVGNAPELCALCTWTI